MKQAFLIIISLLSLKVSAQKTTVAIQKLRTISSPNNRGYNSRQQTESAAQNGEAKIEDFVTAEFVNTKRFNIVDRASLDALKSEKELQKTEDFIDSKVIIPLSTNRESPQGLNLRTAARIQEGLDLLGICTTLET